MDLTPLKTAVDGLKTAVADKLAAAPAGGDDQATVDHLAEELNQLAADLAGPADQPPASAAATSSSPDAPAAAPADVAAWTPPGS